MVALQISIKWLLKIKTYSTKGNKRVYLKSIAYFSDNSFSKCMLRHGVVRVFVSFCVLAITL